MTTAEKVQATVDSGIVPLSFYLEPVRFFSGTESIIRTKLIVNSLEIGMLTFDQYRFIAGRSKQGDALAQRHIEKLLRAMPDFTASFDTATCFTVPVYSRVLPGGKLSKMLFELFSRFPSVSPSLLCIEISADILYEDMNEMRERIAELHDLGVKVAISEIGDEFCPIFRLSGVKLDYAFLDPYVVDSFSGDDRERVGGNVIDYLHSLGAKVIAPNLPDGYAAENAKELDCDGTTDGGFAHSDQIREEDGNGEE